MLSLQGRGRKTDRMFVYCIVHFFALIVSQQLGAPSRSSSQWCDRLVLSKRWTLQNAQLFLPSQPFTEISCTGIIAYVRCPLPVSVSSPSVQNIHGKLMSQQALYFAFQIQELLRRTHSRSYQLCSVIERIIFHMSVKCVTT